MNNTEVYESYLLKVVLAGLKGSQRYVVIRHTETISVRGIKTKAILRYNEEYKNDLSLDDFNETFVDLDLLRKEIEQDGITGFKNTKDLKRYLEDVVIPRRNKVV